MQSSAIQDAFKNWMWWRKCPSTDFLMNTEAEESPIRAELYNVDQLERHAKAIASTHTLAKGRIADQLLPRLTENEQVLVNAYDLISAAAEKNRRIAPAAEWLLDNFYLIEEQIRSTRRLLPKSYSGQLPRLLIGPSANYPRVYGIALELIGHTDGRVDAASLNGFIAAYQSVTPLKLGELWALPLMLRLALIENLRRVAARVACGRCHRDAAVDWAERMIKTVEQSPTDLVLVLADMARENPPLSGAFLAELTRHLQGQNPNFAFAHSWLEHRLAELGQTTEQLVLAEGQAQASDQVSVGNSITSLRFLSVHDWREFVAEQSIVEQTLCGDPTGIYAKMDFATRDRYRHAVEAMARRSCRTEYDVAHLAIELSQTQSHDPANHRSTHVGYFLVDRGRPALERLIQMRLTPSVVIEKIRRRFPLLIFLSLICIFTIVIGAVFLDWSDGKGQSVWLLCLLTIPILACASHLAIGIVNWLTSTIMSPQPLPKMDFRDGIPPEHRTLVAVPTMLITAAGVERLLEGLEIRYLANRDACLHFALITDLEDAAEETHPRDSELVHLACEGINQLNEKYAGERSDIFFLLHRKRRWNAQEKFWMGYERKRGKLADLNAMLRGASDRFENVVGAIDSLSSVKYVITLDTDTQLPRDAAREMVGAMAHPLNRPVFDPDRSRVIDGYTILQPRVGVSLPSANRSWFVRLYGGDPGVDPYTRVVSDVYQDLFGEGSFVGKGIYDVDSFEKRCGDFPENAILSHDLLESCYCRSALLSDVILYEDFPSSYSADVGRRHRWMRGDWQIAGWLMPKVRSLSARGSNNPISPLSWWKIFDNLRRSIVPPAMLLLLLAAWLFASPEFALTATVFVFAIVLIPSFFAAILDFATKPTDLPFTTHLTTTVIGAERPLVQCLLSLVFLPYEAYISLDAIIRTLVRVHWTKTKLLEWRTSSDAERSARVDLLGGYRSMIVAPVVAIVTLLLLLFQRTNATLLLASPLLTLWILSPAIAWKLSRMLPPRIVRITSKQKLFLRKLSRKTWRYFETFVTAEENWLPPDNLQINPHEVVASRTSPTNIGMALLADLAAYDFGYCTVSRLLDRTQNTFSTLSRMERYHGHLFNWYDTRTLTPLNPRYVSTVDSGNLAGQLLVLGSGLRALIDSPIMPRQIFDGLRDTLSVFLDEARKQNLSSSPFAPRKKRGLLEIPDPPMKSGSPDIPASFAERTATLGIPQIDGNTIRSVERRIEELERCPNTLRAAVALLPQLTTQATQLRQAVSDTPELQWWATAIERSCVDALDELNRLATWIAIPTLHERIWESGPADRFELRKELRKRLLELDAVPSLREVGKLPESFFPLIDTIQKAIAAEASDQSEDKLVESEWLKRLRHAISESSQYAIAQIRRLEQTADQCDEFAEMDFDFLHDKSRDLFAIGYNVTENRLDSGCYDLLASEARLASYVLIAQGHFGQEHWFALGRLLTNAGGAPALLSWSGSMFEYLMPLLVMPTYDNTILDQTYRAIVRRQINYGRQRGVPWGISESGYNTVDWNSNYQYRAFGVPGLGLKRGLAEDLVIAPYASALALMVAPEIACLNLERLAADEREGAYGFYEAIDYTLSRLPPGAKSITVRQFMAHHAGMSLLSFAYVLLDKPMQRRFQADPEFHAAELLLHERVPKATVPVFPHAAEASATRSASAEEAGTMRVFTDPSSPVPEVHLLSNGRYHVVVTSAGGGYSRWRDLAVTRWREDPTRDCWGTFCYLRDLQSGRLWSTAWHPTAVASKKYEAIFTQARAEFRRQDELIDSHTDISVSSEDDIELRRITLTNRSEVERMIEVTSYAEVVLATQAQDESHPAFSNLFVQTEIVRAQQAIVCTRRPRSAEENPPWLIHMMTVEGTTVGEPSFETDRMQFIGRGRTLASPAAFDLRGSLSNTDGSTLDPIVSIRRTLLLQPNETVRVDIVTGVAETRDEIQAIADKYSDPRLADRVFELAWTRAPIMLQQLNASEADAQAYGRLAGSMIFASSLRRAKPSVLMRNRRGQSGLWGYGISGDLPIILVRIRSNEKIELVRQAVQAHAYWRMKGLSVDLVIWNEDDSVYRQSLQDSILDVVTASSEAAYIDRPGGIFVRRGEQMSEEDRSLLQTVARVVLLDDAGTLIEQVERRARIEVSIPIFKPARKRIESVDKVELPRRDLAFFNGLGGFSADGREYITILEPNAATPAPWVNVIANSQIGTVVSESGSAYTWADNSHEFRLTPWTNDPVSDSCGEAIYLRDEENGRFWSPSPKPARGDNTYVARHGFGYSIFDYTEDGITTELCVYVAVDAPIKFVRIKITNRSGRPRQLSLTGYWEWVLGEIRGKSLMHVVTEMDPVTGAMFARNPYSHEFASKVAFVDCSESVRTFTGDRTEFLGRNGTLATPAAMRRTRLSNRSGAGLDPCAAMQTHVTLNEGQEKVVVFTIGAGNSEEDARQIVQRFRGEGNAIRALEGVWHYWSQTLGAVHVETPDPAFNYLANGWLIYQTLSCRMWARTGFYQSGGAYGFRDQLQDAMALVYAEPKILREHLLRACSRQFREGDVQHWWHPPAGRGVRTHFSDDFLWLPLALCRYVQTTGDTGILDERIPFLSARALNPDEEANYDLPHISDDIGSVYEHAIRAVDHGLRFGVHGLPLMGCGDWNDGMNLVGQHGQGESVWLAFFMYDVLNQFAKLAQQRDDKTTADRLAVEAGRLRGNIEQNGWDGEWYRRAYFDDGTPLGSAQNSECQIDSISQSWSILSGAGTHERSLIAMESVNRRLIRREDHLIQLLDPPFDKSELNPGYIKGYVPGVRENGGQYTHAAIWTAMAFAALDEKDRAWELFSMINPIHHGSSPNSISKYRVEPYVVAADVYGVEPHTGRGGWTWYTGSAGWMYRLMMESILGLQLDIDKLRFNPHTPSHWSSFVIHYRYRETVYHISIINRGEGKSIKRVTIDGTEQLQHEIPLLNDYQNHQATVELE
jgi:cyclic beta-1,2-glucan synthetase